MGSKEKLVERFKKKPKDFTYEETLSLLAYFGYHEHTKGSTSGHPGSIMKEWMVKTIYQHLKNNGLIK